MSVFPLFWSSSVFFGEKFLATLVPIFGPHELVPIFWPHELVPIFGPYESITIFGPYESITIFGPYFRNIFSIIFF